ncbi:unnamed protein product [Mycena citricolor]|uniref:DUF302 domain-containing protein n=1 Tax=Mycena citricolor TaxID=2018698 RepID=A0AAD2I0F0_9AGAR|nr:unnamed protein product [Mycena citricolor]CAK5283735.1 unnamed protein product [Mycena citricolor]
MLHSTSSLVKSCVALLWLAGAIVAATPGPAQAASRSHDPVHWSITPHTVKLVQVTTPVDYDTVSTRLYSMIGTVNGNATLSTASSLTVLEERVAASVGSSDLIHFAEYNHGGWFQLFNANTTPRFKLFVIGNPLIADTIVKYDIRASYGVPVRVLVMENGNGTKIFYQLPSSVANMIGSEPLQTAAEGLDQTFAALVTNITVAA